MNGWVVITSGTRVAAVPVLAVETVLELEAPLPAPGRRAALRGVVPVRGRLVPLVHLGTLLDEGPAPATRAATGVVVSDGSRRVVLEVDAVPALEQGPAEPLPATWRSGWAAAAFRAPTGLIPVLDVGQLFARLDAPLPESV